MKKLSLYIFLVLMWCNVGFAEDKNVPIQERLMKQIINSAFENDVIITGVKKTKTVDVYATDGIAPSHAEITYFVSDLSSKSIIEFVNLISIRKQNSDINQSSGYIFKIEVKLKRDE